MAHVGVVGEKTAHTEYPSISLEEAIDSINAKLRSDKDLSRYAVNILKSKKYSESIPVFEHMLVGAKRPHNRAEAVKALVLIWTHTKDSRIPSLLKQAIGDSAEVVQIEVLKGLRLMGVDVPEKVVERLAQGEDREKWIVDCGGPLNPLEYMTEE